jgi:DNA-binding transcriptional MerR regulator
MTTMRISQLAERSGIPATTLRFYEDAGLLSAGRTTAGYRVYGEDAVRRVEFIKAAKHLGLPLEEVGKLLAVWDAGACADVKADLRPRIAAQVDQAERRAAELSAFTTTLRAALEHLDALPDRAGPCGPECGLLTATTPSGIDRAADLTLLPNQQAAQQEADRWRTEPVACTLSGDSLRERTAAWHEIVADAVRVDIPDGLRLTLPADRTTAVATLAAAEQQCCSFFDFRFHLDGPVLHLEVRAPASGAALLADLFAPAS